MKFKFFRIAFWLWFVFGSYYTWSFFWRWLLERKYRKQKLTQYSNLAELEKALGRMKWKEDPMSGLFDVISSPEKVEYHLQTAELWKAEVGDCDEFAQYAANRIQDMVTRKVVGLEKVCFVTVNWLDGEGKFHGHNICCFFDPGSMTWGHIGNWYFGVAQMGFVSIEDIANWFGTKTSSAGKTGQLIAYCAVTPDLKERLEWSFS